MRNLLLLLLLCVGFVGGYLLGRGAVEVTATETVRIDTVFYEKPQPLRETSHTIAVRVSRVLFAPQDTVVRLVAQERSDSVDVQVVVEQREYRDSTYRAQVSGPRIGELRPTLDFIETYSRTTERERILTKRSRFAVTAGVGVGYTPQGFQPHIGVSVGVVLWGW